MKFTFRLLYLNFLLATIASCQSQPTSNYANKLEGCLESKDIELLNYLVSNFENHINETYELTSSESYKKYLYDVATVDFPQNFFSYPTFKKDVSKFRRSEFYARTWVKTSSFAEETIIDIPPMVVDGNVREQEVYDPVVIDPTGNYVNCLTQNIQSKTLNDYMEVVKAGIDISPSLVAQALYDNLSEEELDNNLTRVIIAINFHYQIGLMMSDKKADNKR